jgi:hypothetical protein
MTRIISANNNARETKQGIDIDSRVSANSTRSPSNTIRKQTKGGFKVLQNAGVTLGFRTMIKNTDMEVGGKILRES